MNLNVTEPIAPQCISTIQSHETFHLKGLAQAKIIKKIGDFISGS